MRLEASIEVFENGLVSERLSGIKDVNGKQTLDELLSNLKEYLIRVAHQALTEEQAAGNFPKEYITLVDGQRNKPVINVRPFGRIDFVTQAVLHEDLLIVYDEIIKKSKIVTGMYVANNYVFVNNRYVASSMTELEGWVNRKPNLKVGDVIQFVNVAPYARMLEIKGTRAGKVSFKERRQKYSKGSSQKHGKEGTFRAPNGAYFLAARAIRKSYKANFKIRFTFIPGDALGIGSSVFIKSNGRQKFRTTFDKGHKGSAGRPYIYPAVELRIVSGGLSE